MKRHNSLIPLSREHHGALILARLLQKGAPPYKGLPGDPEGKAQYALSFYHDELIEHFIQEERMVPLVSTISPELDTLLETMVEEHTMLHQLFRLVPDAADLPSHLDILGKALEKHVRKEEREIFPLIEQSCNPETLDKLMVSGIMKPDIGDRIDIELLVDTFYDKLMLDKDLAYIFTDLARVNWSEHLPVMYNFWENIILRTGSYEGNPMHLHKHLHHIQPLTEIHFRRWDQIFVRTVDKLFRGPNASLAKERALSISAILREKVLAGQRQPDRQ